MIRLLSSQLTRIISRQLASITKRGEVYLTTGTGDSQSELRSLATQAAVPCPLVLINPRLLPIVLFRHCSHVHHQNNVHFKTSLSSNKKSGLRYPYTSITLPQTTQHWNTFGTRTPFHRPGTQGPLADFTPNLPLQPLHSATWPTRPPTRPSPRPLFLYSQRLPRRISPYTPYHSTTNVPSAAAS